MVNPLYKQHRITYVIQISSVGENRRLTMRKVRDAYDEAIIVKMERFGGEISGEISFYW